MARAPVTQTEMNVTKINTSVSLFQAHGRSYSHSPPSRLPFRGQRPASASLSPRPLTESPASQVKSFKRLSPWEAASRHPLGLVDEAFSLQDLQQDLVSSIRSAAQRRNLPEPPAEWTAKVSYQAQQKPGTWSPIRSQSRAPLPSFAPPTRNPVPAPTGYRSLPRQWRDPGTSLSCSEVRRPVGQQAYKSVYANSMSWGW